MTIEFYHSNKTTI